MNAASQTRCRESLHRLKRSLLDEGEAAIEPNRSDPSETVDEERQALNEMNQAIASRHNRKRADTLRLVDAALRRLKDAPEDFGLCLECEEEIAPRRLELMPYAEYCVQCQSKQDNPRGSTRRKLTDYVG